MNHNDNPELEAQTPAEETAEVKPAAAEQPEAAPATAAETPAAEESAAPVAKKAGSNKKILGSVIAVIAIVALIVLVIVDGRKDSQPAEDPSAPVESELPEEPATPAEPAAPTAVLDFDAAYAKYEPDTVVFTVNGEPVTWSEYYCWICNIYNQLAGTYGISDWNMQLDETLTAEDYILEAAQGQSVQYPLVYGKAAELGITLDDEDMAAVDALIQTDVDTYYGGDKDALLTELKALYISEEYYRTMGGASILYDKLFSHYFGENGEKLSEEDIMAFLTDNGYLHAKHILIKTVDDANQPLEESVIAEKKAEAEAILAELKALPAEELEAAFDAKILEKGEDPGSLSYYDGYYFQAGQMVESFETATRELADGELSELVESPYGYHIIYRPEMRTDDLFELGNDGSAITVRNAAAILLFNNVTADWAQSMEVVFEPEFENLKLDDLFDVE